MAMNMNNYVFDEKSATQYHRSYDYNHYYLKSQENYANDLLNIRGHVFLNEILDMLGMPRSRYGALNGWVKNGHNHISFGIDDPKNEELENSDCQPFYLNFNVQGEIVDLI